MTHETRYGRIKIKVKIDYEIYLTQKERDEIINDIESFIKHRAGGNVKVSDINGHPEFDVREGFGSYFVKTKTGEVAIPK